MCLDRFAGHDLLKDHLCQPSRDRVTDYVVDENGPPLIAKGQLEHRRLAMLTNELLQRRGLLLEMECLAPAMLNRNRDEAVLAELLELAFGPGLNRAGSQLNRHGPLLSD